ncbi:hypothetical protein HDU97_007298 [Phlyctochytrium planicorne]|nr:hypothetical protein HDU97_007298 [Phlyctochytrium planicorne]
MVSTSLWLPSELIENISIFIPLKEKHPLLLVSRQWCRATVSQLYARITWQDVKWLDDRGHDPQTHWGRVKWTEYGDISVSDEDRRRAARLYSLFANSLKPRSNPVFDYFLMISHFDYRWLLVGAAQQDPFVSEEELNKTGILILQRMVRLVSLQGLNESRHLRTFSGPRNNILLRSISMCIRWEDEVEAIVSLPGDTIQELDLSVLSTQDLPVTPMTPAPPVPPVEQPNPLQQPQQPQQPQQNQQTDLEQQPSLFRVETLKRALEFHGQSLRNLTLRGMRSLVISDNLIYLTNLHSLHFENCEIADILCVSSLVNLQHLAIISCPGVTDEKLRVMLPPLAKNLYSLALKCTLATEEAVVEFMGHQGPLPLVSLRLHSAIQDTISHLFFSLLGSRCKNLEVLDITCTAFQVLPFCQYLRLPAASNLKSLSLTQPEFARTLVNDTLVAIVMATISPKLEILDLSRSDITDKSCDIVKRACQGAMNLRRICLVYCDRLTVVGLSHILTIQSLEFLDLRHCYGILDEQGWRDSVPLSSLSLVF